MELDGAIKLYIVSMSAILITPAPDNPNDTLLKHFHLPMLMDGQSIDVIREQACTQALKIWPKTAGYGDHHIVVRPIAHDYYARLLQFAQFDILTVGGDPLENPIEFWCN